MTQISYFSVPGTTPLLGLTIGDLIHSAAKQFGSSEAVVFPYCGDRLSFEEVDKLTDKLASGLLQLGLNSGDNIGIWGPNSSKWYLMHLAAAKAGIISASINSGSQKREIAYYLNKVRMKAIVLGGPYKSIDTYEILEELIPEIKTFKPMKFNSENFPWLRTAITLEDRPRNGALLTFEDILDKGKSETAEVEFRKISREIQFDDAYNIQFTSGTTGDPKAVFLSHHNVVNNSLLIGRRMELSTKDICCAPVPLFHTFGSVVVALSALHFGTTVVFPSPTYSSAEAVTIAAKEKCTLMYGTPTMHIDMMKVIESSRSDVSSLRLIFTGASTCPETLVKRMKEIYTADKVVAAYGLSETSPIISLHSLHETDRTVAETIGCPLENLEIKIVDVHGQVVPVNCPGELCCRGFNTMLGYFEDPERTAQVIDKSRWFHSGDIVEMQPSGQLKFISRIKDMVNRGGENIYPKEIEDFLHQHPAILEAHVFGVPDARLGEVTAVWIALRDSCQLTASDVREYCKGEIAAFKIPMYIKFTNTFPKTGSGKIQKFVMRKRMMEELGIQEL